MKNFTNELKSIGDQIFMNANKLEHIFFYRMCKELVSQCAEWRMIKGTLQELFSRSFAEHNTDLEPEDINKFMSTQIPQSVESRTLLKLLYIMRSKYAFHITEEQWNKIFIYLHKFFERLNFEEKNLVSMNEIVRNVHLFKIIFQIYLVLIFFRCAYHFKIIKIISYNSWNI